MITHEDVQQLAAFYAKDQTAVTFYYSPSTPQDRSHHGDAVLVKDLVRARGLEREERMDATLRHDLDRIQERAAEMRADGGGCRLICACGAQGFWKEFDLPAGPGLSTSLHIGSRFALQELAGRLKVDATCIVLLDREVNRLLRWSAGKLIEERFPEGDVEPHEVRTTGTGDSSKSERRAEDQVMHHFKQIAGYLLPLFERREFEHLVLGGREETLPAFEKHLPTVVAQVLLGRIHCDPRLATHEQIEEAVSRMLAERRAGETQGILRALEGEARRDGLGATGLRDVLQSLERGEVQRLVIARQFEHAGAECGNCHHLEEEFLGQCPICGQPMVAIDEIGGTVIARAFASHGDVLVVEGSEFPEGIGALLRFRADQNTAERLAS